MQRCSSLHMNTRFYFRCLALIYPLFNITPLISPASVKFAAILLMSVLLPSIRLPSFPEP